MDWKRTTSPLSVLLVLLAATACDKDPVVNGGFEPRDPVTIPVLGHGTITNRFAAEVAARGNWAYTTTWGRRPEPGNAIHIWDVSGDGPVLRDSVIVANASTLGDVQISEDSVLLVVATEFRPGSIVIFDRSIPDQLVQLSRFSSADTDAGVHTVKLGHVGGRHYAFLSVDPGPPRLVIVDITDPANPTQVLARTMGLPYVHDVFVRDGLLFTALWDAGMSIWDIGGGDRGGTVENPVLISNIFTRDGNVHNIWWYHSPNGEKRYVFIGEEGPGTAAGGLTSGDVHVVDISDIANPREVAFYHVPGAGAHNFTLDEENGILYAAFYNGGVRALDVRGDLSACDDDARAEDGRCDLLKARRLAGTALTDGNPPVSIWGVARVGEHLYASDMLSGIFKLDIRGLR